MHKNAVPFRRSIQGLCGLMLLGLAAIGASATATAAPLRCDNCDEAAYEAKALTRTYGTHHVYDLVNGAARKFQVLRSCEPGEGCWTEAEPLPVEPEVQNVVIELAAIYAATQGTMKSHFHITTSGPASGYSAFDVAFGGGPRNNVMNWLINTQGSWQNAGIAAHSLLTAAQNIVRDSNRVTLITVNFTDGSSATFAYEAINHTVSFVEGSATDKYGNIIPNNPNQLNGVIFDYSQEGPNGPAGIRMQGHLWNSFGIPVVTGTSTRIITWTCYLGGNGVVCRGR